MIIDHANRLHIGVTNGRAKKFEAAFSHSSTNNVGEGSASRNLLMALPLVLNRHTAHKAPQKFPKKKLALFLFLLHGKEQKADILLKILAFLSFLS